MFYIRKNRNLIVKLAVLLLAFHTTLFAGSSQVVKSLEGQSNYSSRVEEKSGGVENGITQKKVEVSFNHTSMILMLLFTSLLGTFLVKDELGNTF